MTRVRKRNPFINSAQGGRILSALQEPWFTVFPPRGYGVLTTTGRKSGRKRRRCVRAVRRGDRVYLVAIKGTRTGWLRNALANPGVELRIRGGRFAGTARELRDDVERREGREAYCVTLTPFEYLECLNWLPGLPSRAKSRSLHGEWFEQGTPLVVELSRGDS